MSSVYVRILFSYVLFLCIWPLHHIFSCQNASLFTDFYKLWKNGPIFIFVKVEQSCLCLSFCTFFYWLYSMFEIKFLEGLGVFIFKKNFFVNAVSGKTKNFHWSSLWLKQKFSPKNNSHFHHWVVFSLNILFLMINLNPPDF